MDERIRELSKICVAWNKGEIGADKAMYEIWKLFSKENLELWNRKEA